MEHMNTTKQLAKSTDPFEQFRTERLAQQAQAERDRKAEALLAGGLYTHDRKGRRVQLGTGLPVRQTLTLRTAS